MEKNKKMNIYIYKYYWTTLLYRRIQHNFVKQLYLNKLFFQELIRKSICTSTIENSMEVPQNSKDRTTVWSKTLTLPGIHPKEVKAQKQKISAPSKWQSVRMCVFVRLSGACKCPISVY